MNKYGFKMSSGQVGIICGGSEHGRGDIGQRPAVVEKEYVVIEVKAAPVLSLVQFEGTSRYAIKISETSFYQIADLDGHTTYGGGFVGFFTQHYGYCIVHQLDNPENFFYQITNLQGDIYLNRADFSPSAWHVITLILTNIVNCANAMINNHCDWKPIV